MVEERVRAAFAFNMIDNPNACGSMKVNFKKVHSL